MLHARAALVPHLSRHSCRTEALSSASSRRHMAKKQGSKGGNHGQGQGQGQGSTSSGAGAPPPVTEGLGPVPPCLRVTSSGAVSIAVHAKPGARQAAISNVDSPSVGVAVDAPPREGEANVALLDFMSQVLKLKKRQLSLQFGSKSREKVVVAEGCTIHDVHRALIAAQHQS